MNRKITLSLGLLALAVGLVISVSNTNTENTYQIRNKSLQSPEGQFSFLAMMRNNQITGDIPMDEYYKVLKDVKALQANKFKAEWPLTWEFAGPDNYGGRTRAILIDQNDRNILYAGGVSGTVFKSTNRGGTWHPLEMSGNGFGITSMAQTSDDAIFAGTGEVFLGLASYVGEKGSTFAGTGIYKSTDGNTFELINGTVNFGWVAAMAVDPTETGTIYAGTQQGLRYSEDGGATWSLARAGGCKVIKFNKNGRALINIGSQMYITDTPKDQASYVRIAEPGGAVRMEAAWGDSDPTVCYIVTGGPVSGSNFSSSSGLTGLFRSTDNGETWEEIVNQGSEYFSPFTQGTHGQAWYDMVIAVHPRNADRLFIGGMGFAEWTLEEGPKMVGNNFNHPNNPFGIHADKHAIVFDNTGEDVLMYIGSDGGVSVTTSAELDRYADRVTNLTTTQMYRLSANAEGQVIGSTQDQGNIMVSTESFPRKPGVELWGGDGFGCEMSVYNKDVMFFMAQNSSLGRTIDGGENSVRFWDNRIGTDPSVQKSNTFPNALHLWEDMDFVDSAQQYGRTEEMDSLFRSRLFLNTSNGIWMCNNATKGPFNPENPTNTNVRWFRIAARSSVGNSTVYSIASTREGNSIFASNGSGNIYRIDGLNKANWDTTEIVLDNGISDSLSIVNITSNLNIGGRFITDIAVDPTDDNRVVVTVGNYGNSRYVYITENALDAIPTWTSIQGNLPNMPVYTALISKDDPSIILIGTEFGIFATNNGYSSNPTWADARNGDFPTVPVFDLDQVSSKPWTGAMIYAGTHGMGMFKSQSLLTSIDTKEEKAKANLVLYPNPANNSFVLRTSVRGPYTLNIINMNGQQVASMTGTSTGLINVNSSELANGYYFVELLGNNSKAVSKFIVQH